MKMFVASALCLALFTAPALAQGKKSQPAAVDHSDAPLCETVPEAGKSATCRCESGGASGTVWGSGPYTADSSICAAALHAGIIGTDGGALQIVGLPGADSYAASEANGVVTSSWGAYGQSFDVQQARVVSAGVEEAECDVLPSGVDRLACACTDGISGSVWGSGPYTADSNICSAARHSGIVGSGGGSVTVIRLHGLEAYSGSEANGEVTSGWGSYDTSIGFDRN